jgi:acyl-CoA reductase-like NAD-dependent aldehyde dehydrogenase
MYINGQWLGGLREFAVFNPANGEQIGTAPDGGAAEAGSIGWSTHVFHESCAR